jgi:hypothetical protein
MSKSGTFRTEIEVRIEVEYTISPAEPDVGCFSESIEIEEIRVNGYAEGHLFSNDELEGIKEMIFTEHNDAEDQHADYIHDCRKDEG